jgi:hypothetical protein
LVTQFAGAFLSSDSKDALLSRFYKILDEALVTSERTGQRRFEAELHRARGELMLPASPAPAEEAFRTAVAVSKEQSTSSFELRAAMSLAKLYQSTGRPLEAHAILASALEVFWPTPEMPEIAEEQALLERLDQRPMGQSLQRTLRQKADGGWARL